MRIEYVFIRKENLATQIIENGEKLFTPCPPLHVVLRKMFSKVTDSTIEVKYKAKSYQLSYNSIEHTSDDAENTADIQYLTISMDGTNKSRIAEVMDSVHKQIFAHEEKSNYDIIVSYDGISKYYCDRTYPRINEFERQIRNLIFKLLTRSFGSLWLEKTATTEQQNNIKKKLKTSSKSLRNQKMIEEALYEMDIKELENYLFLPHGSMSAIDLRSESFSDEKLKSLPQERLIELVQQLRPISLWERYFEKEVEIDNLREKLESIRFYRNKVAHAKHFYKQDYLILKKILDEMLPQLEVAVQVVSVQEYDSVQLQEAVRGIADTFASAMKHALENIISPVIENFGKSTLEFSQLFKQSVLIQAVEMQNHFPATSQSMMGLSSVLNTLPLQPGINMVLQAEKFLPPPSAIDAVANTQMSMPDASVLTSIEKAPKLIPSQPAIKAFQKIQSSFPEPAFLKSINIVEKMMSTQSILNMTERLAPIYRMDNLISTMERFQDIGANLIEQENFELSDSEFPEIIDSDNDSSESSNLPDKDSIEG